MSGELVRNFVKHKVYGDVYAVERTTPGNEVVAALKVDPRTCCPHQLKDLKLDLDTGEEVAKFYNDVTPVELPCTDATHWLQQIGLQTRIVEEAERTWKAAHDEAKEAKGDLDKEYTALQELCRRATSPEDLPLIAAAEASDDTSNDWDDDKPTEETL